MNEKIAVVYWCDTTGHAARSIPIATELEKRGYDVEMAGGGFGEVFANLNGFELPDLTDLTVAPDGGGSLVLHTLRHTIPRGVKRLKDLFGWLDEEDPDKVVTDDILCVFACAVTGRKFYRIENWNPKMYSFPLKQLYGFYDWFTLRYGEKIVMTSLWPEEDAPEGRARAGPLAQVGDEEVEPYDVLLMPGSWENEFDDIRKRLEDQGYDTKMVGADDWETKAAMTPQTSAASVVLCSGFSSIADSVVGGTHTVVWPNLFLQKGIARGIEDRDIEGIETVWSYDEAVEALERCLESPGETPDFESGAPEFVDHVTGQDS